MRFLVSMGYFDGHDGALVIADMRAERADVVLRYTPPPHLRVPGKGFTGASWAGPSGDSPLLVCGFSAVYRVDPQRWQVTGILHQPCMNDLHHASQHDGRLYLANTGMDAVDVFTEGGQFLGSHACQPAWLSAQRQAGRTPARADWGGLLAPGWSGARMTLRPEVPRGDYYGRSSAGLPGERPFHQRSVRDFVHPNHIIVSGERLLCTRLADRSVVDMRRFEPVIRELPGHPHDGVVHGEHFWLTTVNGLVLAHRMESSAGLWPEIARHDVFARTGRSGWCRGLAVTGEHLLVGLTGIRDQTRFSWNDRHPDLTSEHTESSLLCIERGGGSLVARVDLADGRPSKIYSVLELP